MFSLAINGKCSSLSQNLRPTYEPDPLTLHLMTTMWQFEFSITTSTVMEQVAPTALRLFFSIDVGKFDTRRCVAAPTSILISGFRARGDIFVRNLFSL